MCLSHNTCNCPPGILLLLVFVLLTGTSPDFIGLNMEEFIFMPGTLTQTVTVQTVADMIVEGDETLSLGIDGITGPAQTEPGTPSSVTLTISDNDCKSTVYKCKKHFIKMFKDVGMVVPKIKETR